MKHDEEIEMLIWDFIDGNCNETEQLRIGALIASDSEWKQKFEELSAMHQNISPELEQPSMRFTKNVMDTIAKTQIAPATKKYINQYVVRGIAAFFIISIGSILAYALFTTNWNSAPSSSLSRLNLSQLHLNGIFNNNVIYMFILVNIVLGLLLIDSVFRKRRMQEQK
jgi:hypothetical protein